MPLNLVRFLTLIIYLLALSGCHLFAGSKAASIEAASLTKSKLAAKSGGATTSPVEVQALESGYKTDVEIIWQVPAQAAELFTIQYGFDKEKLDKKVELKPDQLEKYVDPEFGPVYRFVLQNIDPDRDVFVAMSTSAGGQTSEPSKVFQARANPN